MTPERWQQIETLFGRALELPESERAAFLDGTCAGDRELRDELARLLASDAVASSVFHGAVAAAAGTLAAEAITAQVGRRIGPYRLVALLGEGGMGAVYSAVRDDAQFSHEVAIKIVARSIGSPQAVARFRDERQILAALEHPGIVRLLDGGSTDDGLPYLVMEHVEGVPITRYAEAKQLSIDARVELVRRICGALQYAHGNLVVHRDIKPSNILVTDDGTPKILDFGIAKLLDHRAVEREAKTRTGLAMFTPEYASPEQARGEPVATTTDVYSTGAVLFELVTGRPPLGASDGSPLDMLRVICEVDPPRASTAAPPARRRELAGDLDNIIAKALHKEPARRYASMEQLADDLTRYLDGHPVSARTATVGYRAWKFARRNKGAVAAALTVATALVVATVVSTRWARRADEQAARADEEAIRAGSETQRAVEAAERARQETVRAQKAEAQIKTQLDQLRAEQAARAKAEETARTKGDEAELSREQLVTALAKARDDKRLAEEASRKARESEQRAEAAARTEKTTREAFETLYRKAEARAKQLEENKKDITIVLP